MTAGLFAKATRAWTAVYTAGLPGTVRARRCGEIESDLYEHRATYAASGHGSAVISRQVAGRLLRGIPHDILWRLETDREHEHIVRDGGVAPFPFLSAAFIGAVVVFASIFVIVPVHSWQILGWLVVALAGVACLGVGLYVSSFWPRLGGLVVAAGTAAAAWGLWWTYVGPLFALYVGVTGITRARRIEALRG